MRRNEEERRYRRSREYDLGENGPYVYHGRREGQDAYDRYGVNEEAYGGEGTRSRSKGVLRSNPMLLLVIVDILLILLVAGILYPVLREQQDTAQIAGYSFSIQAYRKGEWAHVNVLVERKETEETSGVEGAGENGADEEGGMEIRFAPSEGSIRARHHIVPPRESDPQIVRSRFKAVGATHVKAIVRFAGQQLELKTELDERK